MTTMASDSGTLFKLEMACSDLKTIVESATSTEESLVKMDKRLDVIDETISTASRKIAPLQSLEMATKALDTRINRAVTPALALLDSFKLSDFHQHELLHLSSKLSDAKTTPQKRLKQLLKYVDCVDQLNAAITSISEDGEPVIQKLQEVVEFLSRTKATGQNRILSLRETLITLKALYETEVDAMKFDGLLDEALLNLQDEYESLLQQIKHQKFGEDDDQAEADDQIVIVSDLGTEEEVEVLRRISNTLASNDCLDICIDIFVKVRYRRAAKALMRLNPVYLRTYSPEEIDDMKWESLETAISLWIQHFGVAVKRVLVSEKKLFSQVLGGLMDGLVWPECFVKIADKIMAVFFRFGEGVARSSKEPEKLFKLLDMFDSLQNLKPHFCLVFDDDCEEASGDICNRFRELEKLLIHASSKVFWEFGLQIEGNSDGFPPPKDGSVTKIVRYAINYLKYLATDNYRVVMAKVLRTEQIWKSGILSKPAESEEDLLKEAVSNVMEALRRNVESKRARYRDKILAHIFSMNTYWYIYMRSKNTELGKLLGEEYLKTKYKAVAEESAYTYQKQAWGPLARMLDKEDLMKSQSKEELGCLVRKKVEEFAKGVDENLVRHRSGCYNISDDGLSEQIREAITKLLFPAYTELLNSNSDTLQGTMYVRPESIQGTLNRIFDGGDSKIKRRDSKGRYGLS